MTDAGVTTWTSAPDSPHTARTAAVLPTPDGPWTRAPFGQRTPNDAAWSLYRTGQAISSRSDSSTSSMPSKPPKAPGDSDVDVVHPPKFCREDALPSARGPPPATDMRRKSSARSADIGGGVAVVTKVVGLKNGCLMDSLTHSLTHYSLKPK